MTDTRQDALVEGVVLAAFEVNAFVLDAFWAGRRADEFDEGCPSQ